MKCLTLEKMNTAHINDKSSCAVRIVWFGWHYGLGRFPFGVDLTLLGLKKNIKNVMLIWRDVYLPLSVQDLFNNLNYLFGRQGPNRVYLN